VGGVRMAVDVTTEECARLARAMTLKNAAADLPHGGGKAVLVGDPKMHKAQKEILIRGFCCALREVEQYIFAPDMGTDEECMAWVKDEIGRVVGLPRDLGGIPLDEIGATGFGLSHAIDVAQEFCELDIKGARFVMQGFGAVGKHAARFLCAAGAIAVAVSDSAGTVYNPDGLDVDSLITLKSAGKSVTEHGGGEKRDGDAIIDIECDI
jgi:glutamate dehydrogenase (NAD(P)+)